ncbi:MAG: hypothetical protein ACYSW1_10690 [Planctomycetota bacterium]
MRFATLRAAARTDFLTAFFAVFLAAFLAGFCAAFFADFVAAFFADLFAAARLGCAFVPAVFFVFLAPTTFLAAAASSWPSQPPPQSPSENARSACALAE